MSIAFNSIPSNLRVPFAAVEFDSSRAQQGPALLAYRALLIGQKSTAGSATANSLRKVTSADQVSALAGRGSMLHRMAKAWFANNKATEIWIGVLDDAGAGVAGTCSLTVTGPATTAGTISLYIGGVLVSISVAANDSANSIATAIAAAINASSDLPVTASSVNAVVTVTHRHKGLVGNSTDIRVNYQDGEALPAGVGLMIVPMANGTTNPTLTSLLAAMGDQWFHVIVHPYTDATSLSAIETELASRNGPLRMVDGLAITSAAGTHSALTTLGGGRNSQFSSIVPQPGKSPLTPPEEFAAAVAGVLALYGSADPARPFQTLPVAGVVAPAEADLFTLLERNLCLYDGIATTRVDSGGQVQIERIVTTYQTNGAGADDTAYLDSNTVLTLMYLRYSFRNRFQTRYPRHKLGSDGARVGPGQAVLTPKLAKAEAVCWFRDMADLGLVENPDQFKRDLVVERNAQDPNRLDFLLPPDLINQLVVTAAQIQFGL